MPILGPDGRVVVDVVLFHPELGHLVLFEAKSGSNVEVEQARRYAALDPVAVVQATGISVPRRTDVTVEIAYVCLDENADRIRQGLSSAGLDCPVIRVAKKAIAFDRPGGASTQLDTAWASGPIGLTAPITRLVPYDHESDASLFEDPVRAELVAQMSNRRSGVTVRLLTERVVPYFEFFASSAQHRLIKTVRGVVRSIVDEDTQTYSYVPSTATRRDDAVEFRKTPEDLDPRGRTRAYQAIRGGHGTRPVGGDIRQLDLLDLLAETADEGLAEDDQDDYDGKED